MIMKCLNLNTLVCIYKIFAFETVQLVINFKTDYIRLCFLDSVFDL